MTREPNSLDNPFDSSADFFGRTPYEDHADYIGRWSGLTEAELHAAADADPLRFAADHVLMSDRRQGSVVVVLHLGDDMGSSMNIVPNAPSNPTPDDCQRLLQTFLDAAEHFRREGLSPAIGLLHHRTGPAHITDLDLRWASAMTDLASSAGIGIIGVAARTESGAFVRIHHGNRRSTAA